MIRNPTRTRSLAVVAALTLSVAGAIGADEMPGGDMIVPKPTTPTETPVDATPVDAAIQDRAPVPTALSSEKPVTAAPPSFVAVFAVGMGDDSAADLHEATPSTRATRYEFFAEANADDPWFGQIEDWQARERASRESDAPETRARSSSRRPAAPAASSLDQKYATHFRQQRRELVRRLTHWSQIVAREHYRKDADGAEDPWPTTADLLLRGGDDCDGIDLLAYGQMRDFGFFRGELYRAILRREADLENHMVTFWFEDRGDPWVIDATGAVSASMLRFSELRGWRPRRVFDEHEQFSVVEGGAFQRQE